MNKKGSAMDVFAIIIVLFIVAIGIFFANFFTNQITGAMKTADGINSTAEAVTALESIEGVTDKYDMFTVAFLIGMAIAVIITGYLIGGYPMFMFIYFIFIIVAVLVSAIMSNVWESISSQTTFTATLAAMPMTNSIMINLPYYIAIVGFLGLIATFAKPQE